MTDLDKIRANEGQYSDAWHEYGLTSKPKPRASVVTCCAHDCHQGRDCPLRVRRRLTIKPLVRKRWREW